MVGVAQLVEHLVVVQVAAGSSPVTHPRGPPREDIRAGALLMPLQAPCQGWPGWVRDRPDAAGPGASADRTQWGMLSHNKRSQKITVGVIVGLVIVSLALSLVSVALA